MWSRHANAAAICLMAALAGCGSPAPEGRAEGRLPHGGERVTLDPARFTARIDNRWWPMRPGSRWTYRETDPEGGRQRVVVTVTRATRRIANGVTARVVHDVATEGGRPVEVTDDWYAQDRAGNVWYLGERTTAYERGRPASTEGSWEAGVDGAQPGVVVPARPRAGMRYRQEHYPGHAEDRASVLGVREQVQAPFGHFGPGRVLATREWNPLEPRVVEYKFLARGVGPVLAVGISGGADREELVSFRRGRGPR
jgi:hypothetical protein